MNKSDFFILCFELFVILLLSFGIVNATDATDSAYNLEEKIEDVQNKIEDIPKTPEEIRDRYLRQEWNKIIAKSKFFGPIHNLFFDNPLIFKILFNESYSFSLTFFGIIVLWFLIFFVGGNILREFLKNNYAGYIMGACIAVVAAQASLIKITVQQLYYFIFSQETWWIRALLWISLSILVFVIFYFGQFIAKYIELHKKKKEAEDIKQGVKEARALISGMKEGQKITKDLKKS